MNWLTELFIGNSVAHTLLVYAIVIAIGVFLGKVKIFGISLGATFVLFCGILVGHLGVTVDGPTLKFIQEGIVYDELSEEDKEIYEDTFEDENGELPESIASSALNEWIFNEDTIREVLNILMTHGLKIDYGNKIGKTIIFAKNHTHAEKILEVFGKEYPHLNGYAKVIDNYMTYAQSAIDEFSDPKKMPQIAISVDMLDTGIDVPEVLNLVFFKKVMSKAKF